MKKLAAFLVFFVFLISCNYKNPNAIEISSLGETTIDDYSSIRSKKTLSASNEKGEIENNQEVSRKLIKNGNVVFETDDLEKTKNLVTSLVDKYKGYISSDTKNEYDNKVNYFLNIRIPAQYFDSILSGISSQVSKFDTKEVRISDVTEQYLDVESRLKNKKELEKRYLDILQQAKSVKDILDVERELGKLREEIESTEGRLIYLKNQVSFATLSVSFYKTLSVEDNFFGDIGESFKTGFKNLQSFFIGIIAIWPFIILGIIGYFLLEKWRKRKK